jgi:hypothetical protein
LSISGESFSARCGEPGAQEVGCPSSSDGLGFFKERDGFGEQVEFYEDEGLLAGRVGEKCR